MGIAVCRGDDDSDDAGEEDDAAEDAGAAEDDEEWDDADADEMEESSPIYRLKMTIRHVSACALHTGVCIQT